VSAHLDFGDGAAVRAWIVELRTAFADADAVTQDALALHRRELGRALHETSYGDARERIVALLAYAEPPLEPGDPTGAGSSPAL
jgi:hypothetical protein